MELHEQHVHRILAELESTDGVSQRTLSRNLGIALGLTNLLVRNLVRKGFVRVVRIKPNRVRYLVTPAGIAEKARMSRRVLQRNVRFYVEARDRISEQFAVLSAQWRAPLRSVPNDEKRVEFFGAGEVAEIGYVCLQGTDLTLTGVVDDDRPDFFRVPVHSSEWLRAAAADLPFDRLVVMSFGDAHGIRARLKRLGVPLECLFWI